MKLFDYFSLTFCISGFIYHLFFLFQEYLSGKTVVNLKIGNDYEEELPAITVCPGSMSLDKLANINDHLATIYNNYSDQLNSIKSSLKSNQSSEQLYQAKNTYFSALDYLFDMMNNGTMDIADLFYNYSLSSKDKLGQPRMEFNLTNDEKPKIVEPIASIEIEMTMFKCFTFFSNLDRSWRSIDANIRLRIKLDSNAYPLFYYPIPFALHSPNDLPHLISGKLKPVMSGDTYLFQYSQIKIERLGFGYDTDCREYGAGYDFDIRTDCIIECYQDNFHKICNTTGLPRSFYLIRSRELAILAKKAEPVGGANGRGLGVTVGGA